MLRNRIRFACFAAILVASLIVIGCASYQSQPTTPLVLTTQPSTQPSTQPTTQPGVAVVPPILVVADKGADFVTQHSDLIFAILSLLGVSAAGHATNIAKAVAGVYQKSRSGTVTTADVLQAGTTVADEVAALDPKAAPAIKAGEAIAGVVLAAAQPASAVQPVPTQPVAAAPAAKPA